MGQPGVHICIIVPCSLAVHGQTGFGEEQPGLCTLPFLAGPRGGSPLGGCHSTLLVLLLIWVELPGVCTDFIAMESGCVQGSPMSVHKMWSQAGSFSVWAELCFVCL